MGIDNTDKRLVKPVCDALQPVKMLHDNPWFTVVDRGGYYTTEFKQQQVMVLPVIADNAIVMVKVKRPVLADETFELPAGGVEHCETAVTAASRELYEETGILVNDLSRFIALRPLSVTPNRNPLLLHVFKVHLSQEEFDGREHPDEEIVDVYSYSYQNAMQMLIDGSIYISTPIAILSRYFLENKITVK